MTILLIGMHDVIFLFFKVLKKKLTRLKEELTI